MPHALRIFTASEGWRDIVIAGAPGATGPTGPAGPAGPTGPVRMLASWQGVVPSAAQVGAVWRVPFVEGVALTFNLVSAYARVEVAGVATTSVALEKSPAGAFVATAVTSLDVAAGANEVEGTTGLGTVSSGGLLRIKWTAIGSPGSAYTIELAGVKA
jgi:hypothetical protein